MALHEIEKHSGEENILQEFMKKAYTSEMEAYLADAEYSYIQEADKRAFYMAIELWKKEAGPGMVIFSSCILIANEEKRNQRTSGTEKFYERLKIKNRKL